MVFKILVVGGRQYARPKSNDNSQENEIARSQYDKVLRTLDQLSIDHSQHYSPYNNWLPSDITIIEGGAKGIDSAAGDWAIVNYAQLIEVKANWDKYGLKAGWIRNNEMADLGPDLVVLFPGGKGTEMMKKIALNRRFPIMEVGFDD